MLKNLDRHRNETQRLWRQEETGGFLHRAFVLIEIASLGATATAGVNINYQLVAAWRSSLGFVPGSIP